MIPPMQVICCVEQGAEYVNVPGGAVESYFLSITGGISTNNQLHAENEVKLMPVPELSYFPTDKSVPRGEIWVKNKNMIPGYYKDEAETLKRFEDGWFKTGDIGELDTASNRIRIIDRKG